MSLRHIYNVSVLALQLGFRQVFANKLILLGSFGVYSVIMTLYGGVINMISPEDIAPYGLTNAQMIWYMGTTELVLFCCVFWIFKEVQEEVRSEQIHLTFMRPYSPSLLRVAIWCGEAIARLCAFFPLYSVLMFILAGDVELTPRVLMGVFASIPIGVFLVMCSIYFMGVSCLWLVQSEIALFVIQKFIFLLGAMMWPLMIYPELAQYVAWATPFPAMLAVPANWLLDYTYFERGIMFVHQIFWGIIGLWFLLWLDKKMLRIIQRAKG